jgi:hypothetical protein
MSKNWKNIQMMLRSKEFELDRLLHFYQEQLWEVEGESLQEVQAKIDGVTKELSAVRLQLYANPTQVGG